MPGAVAKGACLGRTERTGQDVWKEMRVFGVVRVGCSSPISLVQTQWTRDGLDHWIRHDHSRVDRPQREADAMPWHRPQTLLRTWPRPRTPSPLLWVSLSRTARCVPSTVWSGDLRTGNSRPHHCLELTSRRLSRKDPRGRILRDQCFGRSYNQRFVVRGRQLEVLHQHKVELNDGLDHRR